MRDWTCFSSSWRVHCNTGDASSRDTPIEFPTLRLRHWHLTCEISVFRSGCFWVDRPASLEWKFHLEYRYPTFYHPLSRGSPIVNHPYLGYPHLRNPPGKTPGCPFPIGWLISRGGCLPLWQWANDRLSTSHGPRNIFNKRTLLVGTLVNSLHVGITMS